MTLGKQCGLPSTTQAKYSRRLVYVISVSNMQPQKKDGSSSLVAAWTFHLSSGAALQKLVAAGLPVIYSLVR